MRKFTKNLISMLVAFVMIVTCIPAMNMKTIDAATSVPTALTFVENSDDSVTISWEAVSGATSYYVYEAVSRYATYTKVGEVETTTYTDNSYEGGYYKVSAIVGGKETDKSTPISYEIEMFGLDTDIFEETDDMNQIQDHFNEVYKTTEAGQFGQDRHAYLFAPGTYHKEDKDLSVEIGFYTQVAGLGISPEDTEVDKINCKAEWMMGIKYDGGVNYNACCNFWRSVENLTTDASDTLWAVSQATAMRRMNFTGSIKTVRERDKNGKWISYEKHVGDLYLHQQGGYASGGFLADSKIYGDISMGSQQQWLTRNTIAGNMQAAVWNNVVVGSGSEVVNEDGTTTITKMNGTQNGWPNGTNTVVDETPIIQEKPFLAIDTEGKYGEVGAYGVFVPEIRRNAVGVSWDGDEIKGEFINVDEFFVAKPTNTVDEINAALAEGKNLILTPGIYKYSKPIVVNNSDTVILGMGYATIEVTNGNQAMTIGNVEGVILAGILFDAGPVKSKVLLTVGTEKNETEYEDYSVALCDTFYRVGGASREPGTTETCVIVNSNNVIGDNFWVWRADHGAGVAWDKNKSEHGVIINGDNVTTYGLMVEHFQKEQTIWNGDNGRCYMYQSELPYDIKSQDVWNATGSYGYASYNVSSNVKYHEGYGIGVYSCYQAATCFAESGLKCPDTPGVKFTNVCTYSLVGNGGIDYAINDSGYGVYGSSDMCKIMSYCNGVADVDKTGNLAKKVVWSATLEIPQYIYAYTGKAIKPKASVKYKGIKLREGVDYKIIYKNNTEVGTNAKVILQGIGNFRESKEITFTIRPGRIKNLKSVSKKKKITLKWAKVKGAKKYQVVYAKNKKFKKKTTKFVRKNKITITRKDKKTYYIKVRACRNRKGQKKLHYGKYSKVIRAKYKK